MKGLLVLLICIRLTCPGSINISAGEKLSGKEPLAVKKCVDFNIVGDGSNPEWLNIKWNELIKLDSGGEEYKSRFKIMYSGKGIYLLFEGEDQKITTKFVKDFDNLFEGDVFEVFFLPDPEIPLYLEYEINQLNKELVLIMDGFPGIMKMNEGL
jgi:hypothetical protein